MERQNMKKTIEKGFRQLFGMEVKIINLPNIDMAIYIMNKKVIKLNEKSLCELIPNFTIVSLNKTYDSWVFNINYFDETGVLGYTKESIQTYKTSEDALVGLMKEWFGCEILDKFIKRNLL